MSVTVKRTQDELHAELVARFGDDPMGWAFQCPACKDIATGADMKAALAANPQTRRDGSPTMASDILGQECIGRTTGAPAAHERKRSETRRGCNWAAYGLFRGPDFVVLPDGSEIPSFSIAPVSAAVTA